MIICDPKHPDIQTTVLKCYLKVMWKELKDSFGKNKQQPKKS